MTTTPLHLTFPTVPSPIDEAPFPVLRFSKTGRLLFANDAALQLPEEMPGYGNIVWQDIIKTAYDKKTDSVIHIPAGDKQYHFLCSPQPKLGYVNVYAQGVTAIEKADESLRLIEERFCQLVENVGDIVCRVTPEGIIRHVNSQGLALSGYTEKELIGQLFSTLIHPDHKEDVREFYRRQIREATSSTYHEFKMITRDGRSIWMGQNVCAIMSNGRLIEYFVVARDITAYRMANEAIQRSEEKYRRMIDNMNLGLLEVDNFGRIVSINKYLYELAGYDSEEELIGMPALQAIRLDEEGVSQVMSALERRKEGKSNAYELHMTTRKNDHYWMMVSGAPVYNSSGQVVGSMGIHIDITERKKAEAEVAEARLRAEASSKAKQVFLANMSHEIRTPMNAIIGMTHLLQETPLSFRQIAYLDAIRKSSSDLLAILNDILDFSKIESGKMELSLVGFDLQDLLEHQIGTFTYTAEEKGLELVSVIDDRIHPVLIGDSLRINQVLLNMVSNALKFTDAGRVCICCRVLRDQPDNQRIRFEVCDTGIGIDQEKLEHIFDSFAQEDASVARRFGGTGLGLAICQQLIELMGGEISVISEKGKGSIFRFELDLPKGTSADITSTEPVQAGSKNLDGVRVLLAEDNQTNQYLMATLLNSWSVHVDIAANGFEAIDLLQNNCYDLVLMDIQMPLCDGLEATNIIRNRLKRDLPIIALTANALKGDEERYLEAGMDGYLSKPIDPNNLYAKIAAVIEQIEKPAAVPSCTYDLSNIRETFRGNEQQVTHLVNLFINESLIIAETLRIAKDLTTIRNQAHKIKAALDTLQVDPLREDVRRIERLAAAEVPPVELNSLLNQFYKQVLALGDALRNDLEAGKKCC